MPNNDLIKSAIQYRYRLDRQSAADIDRLIRAYTSMSARLKDKIDLLILEIEKAGGSLTSGQIVRMARYKQLMEALQTELAQYNTYLTVELGNIANKALAQASLDIRRLIQLGGGGWAALNKLPTNSIKTLLGFLQPDSPLYRRLQELAPLTVDNIARNLLEGVALGYGPRKVANLFVRDLGQGLSSAMRWARTTQMWTYREASRATMAANGDILDGWVWFAILDDAVPPCESCLANHGQLFPLDEPLDDHYNGRCVALPHVAGDEMPVGSGEEWFSKLDEGKQREILGAQKWEAWNGGAFNFSDLTRQTEDDVFGTMHTATPLWELLGAEPPLRTK